MNRNLDDIMRINGTKYSDSYKDEYLEELVDNYNELNEDKTISNFKLLSKTVDAVSCIIDGTFKKILVKETEGKTIISTELNSIKNGSLMEFYNKDREKEYYLVTGKLVDKEDYIEAEVKLCNQMINLKNIKSPIPCIFKYNTSDTEGVQILEYKGLAEIIVKKTDETKNIKLKHRFIFNNSKEEIFEVLDINATEYSGLYVYLVQKTEYMNEDDLVNNIGYSPKNEGETNNNSGSIPIIIGSDKITFGNQETYSINETGVIFSLTDTLSANIISQNGSSCIIESQTKNYKKNTIVAKKNDVVITRKNIIITI